MLGSDGKLDQGRYRGGTSPHTSHFGFFPGAEAAGGLARRLHHMDRESNILNILKKLTIRATVEGRDSDWVDTMVEQHRRRMRDRNLMEIITLLRHWGLVSMEVGRQREDVGLSVETGRHDG